MNKPIYGHVPGALPPPALPDGLRLEESEQEAEKKKRDDWARGYPRGTKRADVLAGTAVPLDPLPRAQVKRKPGRPPGSPNKSSAPPPPPAPNACVGCGKPLSPLSLEMVGELLRMARDRLAEAGGDGRTDLLFLAARIDGCCSVSCWSHNVAPEQLVAALFGDRR